MTRSIRILVLAVLFLGGSKFAFGLSGFVLGDAANYAVIFQAGGNNDLNINNGPGAEDLAVSGNIGIANSGPGNNGSLQLSGPLTLNSDIHFSGAENDNGPWSGNIHVNGTVSTGKTNVRTDMDMLGVLSKTLGAEAGTSVGLNTGSSINVASGMLDAMGNRVFTVSGINAPNGTLTLNGNGVNKVVFNISLAADGNFHFNNIALTGGLTADDVLFNFFGGDDTTHTGGPTLDINSNGDVGDPPLFGIFLDPNGQISIVHSVLMGRIFGGDSHNEQIVSGAQINAPPGQVPDAGATILLMGLGLAFLAGAKRKFRS